MAQIPYYMCALAALASAARLGVGIVYRRQPRMAIVGLVASLVLSLAFALLCITAGPAPVIMRAEALDEIRWLFTGGGSLWLLWVLLDMGKGVRIRKA
jgi:hypothetical protein